MPRMRVTMLQMPAILPQMWVLYLCPKCRYICPKCGQLCPSSAIQEAVRARTTKSFTPDRIEKIPLLAVDPRKIHSENRQVVTLNLHGSSVILRPQNCRNFDTRSTVPRPFGAMEELVFCCPSNYCLQRDPLWGKKVPSVSTCINMHQHKRGFPLQASKYLQPWYFCAAYFRGKVGSPLLDKDAARSNRLAWCGILKQSQRRTIQDSTQGHTMPDSLYERICIALFRISVVTSCKFSEIKQNQGTSQFRSQSNKPHVCTQDQVISHFCITIIKDCVCVYNNILVYVFHRRVYI